MRLLLEREFFVTQNYLYIKKMNLKYFVLPLRAKKQRYGKRTSRTI